MSEKKPLIKTAEMTDEEWSELESLVAEYQEKNPDWERTGFETIEDMKKLIAGETLTTDREKAEKVFEEADIANARKRAEELSEWAGMYKHAMSQVILAKEHLRNIVERAKEKGIKKEMLDALLVGFFAQGVEKTAFLEAIQPKQDENMGADTCEE